MTNLKGALSKAHSIFGELIGNNIKHLYRDKANKAIMLFSDGKGNTRIDGKTDWANGNNVQTEVDNIKTFQNVEVYTVGVTSSSDSNTLGKIIATDESMYLHQPSFAQLKDLARLIRGGM